MAYRELSPTETLQELHLYPPIIYVDERHEFAALTAKELLLKAGVDEEQSSTVLDLFNRFCAFDRTCGEGSVRVAEMAAEGADDVESVLGQPVDKGLTVVSSLLHDIGKIGVGRELVRKSNEGIHWDDNDQGAMKQHPKYTYHILSAYGLRGPALIGGEHHGSQGEKSYSIGARLSVGQLLTRDLTASADTHDAIVTRNNNLTNGMGYPARVRESRSAMRNNVYTVERYGNAAIYMAARLADTYESVLPETRARMAN